MLNIKKNKVECILGAHWLSVAFILNNYTALQLAMETTVKNGGSIFEIPYLLCQLGWEKVAMAAKAAGIKEVSLCHFFPMNEDGSSVCGDPLGSPEEVQRALSKIVEIIGAAEIIRQNDVEVRFIDGPTHVGLGKKYEEDQCELEKRMVQFLYAAGEKCKAAGLFLAVEFLRPVEDTVIKGTRKMISILERVDHESVGMHFDVFHSVECGEDPAVMIRLAYKWIIYLHLHGDKRLAPGQERDKRDWRGIVMAIMEIEVWMPGIPVISEPFGKETCKENPKLGDGLEDFPALPLAEYLPLAFSTLTGAGLPLMS